MISPARPVARPTDEEEAALLRSVSNLGDRLLLRVLLDLDNGGDLGAYPGHALLAARTGWSAKTVRNRLSRLFQQGLIVSRRGGADGFTCYYVHPAMSRETGTPGRQADVPADVPRDRDTKAVDVPADVPADVPTVGTSSRRGRETTKPSRSTDTWLTGYIRDYEAVHGIAHIGKFLQPFSGLEQLLARESGQEREHLRDHRIRPLWRQWLMQRREEGKPAAPAWFCESFRQIEGRVNGDGEIVIGIPEDAWFRGGSGQ